MKLEHQINSETNNSLQGTTKCTEIHVDHHNHLYNGRYMDLIIKILKKNVPSLLQDILNTKTILLENLQYTEDLIFKREISKGEIQYTISLEPREKSLHLTGTFQQKEQETTKFTVELTNQGIDKETFPIEKEGLQLLSQKRDKHELTSTCIAGKLSTQTLKGLLEVERGRYLSLLMTGNEDYYAMMKEKSIAFMSHSSQFTYKQPLSPGELYTIETYFPTKNIENKNLKLPFYQEIRHAQGQIIATSQNTMVQVFLLEGIPKKLQQTFIKNL